VRRQPQPLTHLTREEQRLLLVLHLMLLLPPEYDGSKPLKPQQGRGNGAAKGNKLPRQESKGARQHEARAQSQLSGAHRGGCKNYSVYHTCSADAGLSRARTQGKARWHVAYGTGKPRPSASVPGFSQGYPEAEAVVACLCHQGLPSCQGCQGPVLQSQSECML